MRAPVFLLLLASAPCCPQSAEKGVGFEAASLKRIAPGEPRGQMIWRGGPGTGSPGRFTMPSATLAQMIEKAYGVWPDQITGPAWITNRDAYAYSLAATMPANTTEEQFRAMMQTLLAERFHLRLHRVTQSRPGYELVVAEGGPRIKEWKPPDPGAKFQPGADAKGFPKMNPSFGQGAIMVVPRSGGAAAPIRMTLRQTMAMFCRELGAQINISEGMPFDGSQPRVVDNTGLQGIYEFSLEYSGSLRASGQMPPSAEGDAGTAAASDPAPDIFTAVEKQLGLKLRKLKNVTVDVLVVDSADKVPADN